MVAPKFPNSPTLDLRSVDAVDALDALLKSSSRPTCIDVFSVFWLGSLPYHNLFYVEVVGLDGYFAGIV